jgi:hypothetical protein
MVSDMGPAIFTLCPWLLPHAWLIEGKIDRPDEFRHAVPIETDAEYKVCCKSILWKSIQKRVLERDGHQCVACGRLAGGVHHRDYRPRVMSGEEIGRIVALCHTCYEAILIGNKDAGADVETALSIRVASYEG